jgi:hypothetical protein
MSRKYNEKPTKVEENSMQNKIVIPGKVDHLSNKKFGIKKDKDSEIDTEVEIAEGGYEVEKPDRSRNIPTAGNSPR